MNILEKIVVAKRKEISDLKRLVNYGDLERSVHFKQKGPSFVEFISVDEPSIIAEFKRRSPSKGSLKEDAGVLEIVTGYESAGAAAVSVLTDRHFDGRKEDIEKIAGRISIPVLRKDFVVDEIQILEAKSIGASAILLIAAVLEKDEIRQFTGFAHNLGLDVLLELHDLHEIDKIPEDLQIVGVNNRNLNTFEVDLEHSLSLVEELPERMIKVSESGISSVGTIRSLYNQGFDAFLIGESFMRTANPAETARNFISELRILKTS